MSDGRSIRLCCCLTNRELVGHLQLPLLGQAFQMSELCTLNICTVPADLHTQYSYVTSYQMPRLSVSGVLGSFCLISFGFSFLGSSLSCQSYAK